MTPQLKKKLIPAALVVAVLVLGYVAWQKMRPAGPGEGFVSGNGRIEATEIDVATKLAGRVESSCARRLRQGRPAAGHHAGRLADGPARRSARRQALDTVVGAQAQVAMRESDKAAALAMVAQREAELDAAKRRLARSNAVAEGAVGAGTGRRPRPRAQRPPP
jgi:HlyD family secretion protein